VEGVVFLIGEYLFSLSRSEHVHIDLDFPFIKLGIIVQETLAR